MQPFVDPARKLRAALSDCTSTHPTLDYIIRLAFRLPTDENGHRDYRNTDPQTRQTSLHLAALKGRTDVFEWFLEEGVDEGEVSRDVVGDTVVHIAAAKGYSEIADLYLNRYPFVVEWVNSRGMSPLHFACKEGHLEIAQTCHRVLIDDFQQLLVEVGADLDAPDLEGNTPLHYASAWGKISLLRFLIDQDCQTDWRNNEGFTPAEFAFSFGVLRELESAIKQHFDDLKDARRQARRDRRSKRAQLQEKRLGPASPLSIRPPPAGEHADGPGYAMGLGLSKQQSTESNDPDNHEGFPRLGQAIPPTPRNGSPRYAVNAFRDQRPPLRQTANSPPSSPMSSVFRYPNTTSPQPSPSASMASSAVPITAEDRVASQDGASSALRSVSTHSSLTAGGQSDAARSPSRITPIPAQAHVFRPPHRKHSSSFGAAGVALAPVFDAVRPEGSDAPPLAPPVLAPVPGLSPSTNTDYAHMPENWPPGAEPLLPPAPSPPPPAHHNKLVRKSRPGSAVAGRASSPASPPQPTHAWFEPTVHSRTMAEQSDALTHQAGPPLDLASAYDSDGAQNAPPDSLRDLGQQPSSSQQFAYGQAHQPLPAARAVILPQHPQAMLPPGRNSVDGRRSVSGPAAAAHYDSHYPRASFETDGSARTSATGSSVIISPYRGPRGAGTMHDPRRAVSHAQLRQQQQQLQQDRHSVRLVPPNAQSTTSLPTGPVASSSGRAKLRKHRKGSHDLTRTTSASTGTGSVKSGGGRLARAFGFGKKS
ncbi:hypothetical protein BMF94_3620 [Rhodotorula taiwanensis]|uniref:protein S-acyltransferase n=1 Tax=Rhodotorula taiwanensis TaxID=741276 RepID=A0A2S5B936_9BASI|nr:hypothetical protein BMF94_3620 [Rhodotorula taiwanensis]